MPLHQARDAGREAVAMTKAFVFAFKSWIASEPTPPAPPMTKTRLTLTGSAPASRNIASQAVIAPTGRLAAAE